MGERQWYQDSPLHCQNAPAGKRDSRSGHRCSGARDGTSPHDLLWISPHPVPTWAIPVYPLSAGTRLSLGCRRSATPSVLGCAELLPAANTAAYSDILLSVGPVYWLWRAAGASPDLAFAFWMIAMSALNYGVGNCPLPQGPRVCVAAVGCRQLPGGLRRAPGLTRWATNRCSLVFLS